MRDHNATQHAVAHGYEYRLPQLTLARDYGATLTLAGALAKLFQDNDRESPC